MKYLILAMASMVLMSGCARVWPGAAKKRVSVIAHRGASFHSPENTLSAFSLAAQMKADWFELDCMLSRDGEVIVAHDRTVDRTTNGKGRIDSLTLAEIQRLDAGSWKDPKFAGEPMPTLREALELAARERIGVYIEIKEIAKDLALKQRILETADGRVIAQDPAFAGEVIRTIEQGGTPSLELARKTVALVRELGLQDRVVIQSFSPIICAVVRIEAPEVRNELLGEENPVEYRTWSGFLRFATLIGVDGCNIPKNLVTRERVKAFHKEGRTVAVWTVDDAEEMRRQTRLGVDAIITNRPDICLDVVRKSGRHE